MTIQLGVFRRPLTLALMLASAALGVLLIARMWHGTDTQALLRTPAHKYAPPSVTLALPAATRPGIREHALLHATREFFVPPPQVAMPATPPPPDYRLVGTFIIPRKPTIALLASSSGASRKVRPGDDLDGWLVQAVETRRVILQFGNQSAEISVTEKSPSSGMTAAPVSRRSTEPLPVVRTLGTGSAPGKPASGAVREASAGANPLSTDARLYRPPPQ